MNENVTKEKVDKYFRMLHPDFSNYSQEDELRALADEDFIKNNLTWVDSQYTFLTTKKAKEYTSPRDLMVDVIWHAKSEKYYNMLHPNEASYSTNQKFDAYADKTYIVENVEQIHDLYEQYSRKGDFVNVPDQERLKQVLWHAKVENYFDLLHPDIDSYSQEQKDAANEDKNFLVQHTDEIHNLITKEFSSKLSPRSMQGATEREKLLAAMKEVKEKLRQKETKKIKPKDAIDYVLKSGTTKEDASRAKAQEISRDNMRENEGEKGNG